MIHVCVFYNSLHNVTKPYILLLMGHVIFFPQKWLASLQPSS